MYVVLALVVAVLHQVWAYRVRLALSVRAGGRVPGLSPQWVTHLQNWLVRVLLPVGIVFVEGNDPRFVGFRLPRMDVKIFASLLFLTGFSLLVFVCVIWFALRVARDPRAIRQVRSWPTKLDLTWKRDLLGPVLWTVPEECFLRGYLVSQFAAVGSGVALLVSSFFTAAVHWYAGRFWVLLSAFSGVIYGLAFLWTGSLLPVVIIHAVGNQILAPLLAPWAIGLIPEKGPLD